MLVFLLIVTLLWQRTGALPTSAGPTTVPTIVHNVVFGVFARTSCSDVRSMYEIVRSCLFTIAACVYRAVHPNIPDPKLSFLGKLSVTIKITIYALLAPEIVIYWAMRQRLGAKTVVAEVNAIEPELNWTQTHGQFAQMGGFGRKDNKRILHPPTLIQLLKDHQIDLDQLRLTQKEINDKSKGDILSKGLVAFQTTWFVFECLARLQQGLPIIELEVVTLAFATLNAITYALWWYKPLNVMCPIYIHIRPITPPRTSEPPPLENPTVGTPEESPVLDGEQLVAMQSDQIGGAAIAKREDDPLLGGEVVASQVKAGRMTKVKEAVRKVTTAIREQLMSVVVELKKDLRSKGWWVTASEWLVLKPAVAIVSPFGEMLGDDEVPFSPTHVSTFYAMEAPIEKMAWLIIPSCIVGISFGGIHFLSWDSTFPNHVQHNLWRASSVVMVAQPLLVLLMDLSDILRRRAPTGSYLEAITRLLAGVLGVVSVVGGLVPYILARICVVVLAFLTLRDIPLESFTDVSWTRYIPHF